MTFSIITVTYNAAQWIERTIQSILSQTCKDIEYIIVDGSSTDETIEIITNYELQITNKYRFHWISEPDKGLYDAMNKGLKIATGDYVWFINAGDQIHSPNTIQKINSQLSILNSQFSILYGEAEISDAQGNSLGMRRLKAPEKLTWKSFRMGMLVSHQSFIVKREIAEPYDLQYHYTADFDWCIRCLKKADLILNTHLTLSYFLEAGYSATNRKASLKERYAIMCKYYGKIPTQIRHLWFAVRFYTAKLLKKNIY
ncbi:MAG: glycosyltransferase [Candidatus Symbiothrix sp.]|jgi:glycosyltransferase involved in cell wall biosynthesis|nr:glycosyltransferase [Candidatus Symbiothrix sp.]